jgi:5-hydroxyisourate hydrolase-like protein (transthyretin family)
MATGVAALSVISLCLTGGAFAQTQPGYTFAVTVRTETEKKKSEKPLVFRTSVAGKNGRVDVVQGNKEYQAGDYLLTFDGGETFWVVSAKKKEAMRFTPERLRGEVGKEKFNLTDISLSPPAPSGQKETVAGEPTETHRSLRRYVISGRQLIWTFRVEVEEDWAFSMATNRADMPSFNPAVSFFAMTGSAVLFKDATYAASGYKTAVPAGMPLKAVAVATTKEKKKREVETTIIECDAPVAAAIESARFTLPDGVKRKE